MKSPLHAALTAFLITSGRKRSYSTSHMLLRASKFTPESTKPPPQLNRRQRMETILHRDGPSCVWCQDPLTMDTATTDHLIPKLKGGPSWIENEMAACRRCNKQRGHVRPTEWMEECQSRGWEPKVTAICNNLEALDQAIQERGGQRKARPVLARELKRLSTHR